MSRNVRDCKMSQGLSALLTESWTDHYTREIFTPFHISLVLGCEVSATLSENGNKGKIMCLSDITILATFHTAISLKRL